jgi:hypothetical protein
MAVEGCFNAPLNSARRHSGKALGSDRGRQVTHPFSMHPKTLPPQPEHRPARIYRGPQSALCMTRPWPIAAHPTMSSLETDIITLADFQVKEDPRACA